LENAVAAYRQTLALCPRHANAHSNLGAALLAQGLAPDALRHFERALAVDPRHFEARNNLATALVSLGRFAEAAVHYERALELCPRRAATHFNLAGALAQLGKIDEAIERYRDALRIMPDYAAAHNNLANLLAAQGSSAAAVAHYRRVIAIDPNHAGAHNNLGNMLRDQGDFSAALEHFDRAVALRPAPETHYNRAEIKTFRAGDPDLAALEALARRGDWSPEQSPFVHFALAKALEDSGDYARALRHLQRGNDLKRGRIRYDEAAVARLFRRIAQVFDRQLIENRAGEGDPSPAPVFVLGMPRSGSSLIEQILASHPQIHGAGELEILERVAGPHFPEGIESLADDDLRRMGADYLDRLPRLADGKLRVIDKLPANFLRIGLIRLILPGARIIHTVRNPIDTCVSCYSKLFAGGQHFTYNLAELGRYYRLYDNLMAHWRSVLPPGAMIEVSYEDVVDDLEGQARRLIDYCGLPWDDRCLAFHKNTRTVRTASAVQVRKPLFRSSLQRWRRFESGLGPLLDALEQTPSSEGVAA
jgi:tetratricopeptide (TPR) repeat protein